MPKLKLTYFDFNGGRGEANRLAMAIANIPFEDDRIPQADWPELKPSVRFQALPVLEVDGEKISQSNTISRYIGKLGGLYPEDPLEAARCDEVLEALEDVTNKMVPTLFMTDEDEKRKAREALAAGPFTLYLTKLGQILEDRGGEYFADGRLTIADIKVFLWVRHLRSGALDYVPADLVDRLAPNLVGLFERVNSNPAVIAWYEAH